MTQFRVPSIVEPEPEPEPESESEPRPSYPIGQRLVWFNGDTEKPAGEINNGTWTKVVYTVEQQVKYGVDQDGIFIGYEMSEKNVINYRYNYLLRMCIHIWSNGCDTPRMHIHGLHPNFSYVNSPNNGPVEDTDDTDGTDDIDSDDVYREEDVGDESSENDYNNNYIPAKSRFRSPTLIPKETSQKSKLDDVSDIEKGKKQRWTDEDQNSFENILQKLKYNRIISYFFFYELKKKEQYWSWTIILISTFTSGLTVLNNLVDKEELPEYIETGNNVALTVFSMITSLIAAWIKKERYVERLNELDRYSQKINKICEEIDFELIKHKKDRRDYKKFKQIHYPLIAEYLGSNPSISPKEWKHSVYKITTKYPELITWSGSKDEYLWPWYKEIDPNKTDREESDFADIIRSSYKKKKRFWFF